MERAFRNLSRNNFFILSYIFRSDYRKNKNNN
jgi:hypothetical protein